MKQWNPERLRPRVQSGPYGPSMTVQSDRDMAEVQTILRKFGAEGLLADDLRQAQLQFLDVTHFEDYADVMRTARNAEAEFMKLPSKVREIFNHDAAEWLDAAHDPDKRARALSKLESKRGGTPNVELDQTSLEGPPGPPPADSESPT